MLIAILLVAWGSWLSFSNKNEAMLLPYALLSILGFPSSSLVFYFASTVGGWITSVGNLSEIPSWFDIAVFLVMALIGYLQWFWLVPSAIKFTKEISRSIRIRRMQKRDE